MPVCKQCGNKWSWKQTLKKSTFISGDGMICPYCKEINIYPHHQEEM